MIFMDLRSTSCHCIDLINRKWGRWDGPDNDKYSVMYFDQGQNCWNGPNRSVKVRFFSTILHHFVCGILKIIFFCMLAEVDLRSKL